MRISQREARRLQKRVAGLERQIASQRSVWSQEYFGGVNITTAQYDANGAIPVAIRTARKLNHAVVVIGSDDGSIRFMALPHPKEPV